MQKPASLRQAITKAIPDLATNPEALTLLVSGGKIAARLPCLSFEYSYTLELILVDFTQEPETVILPVLAWLQTNQPDLLQNHQNANSAISFEAQILDAATYDISISLNLTEVIITNSNPDGSFSMQSAAEPQIDPEFLADLGLAPNLTELTGIIT